MKIKRFFTDRKNGPYYDIVWEHRKSEIRSSNGKLIFAEDTVIVPSFWSQLAADILTQKYFRKAGVPADKIYEWKKWAKIIDNPEDPGNSLPEDGAEHDARQVFHRLACTWLDWGKQNKYFDTFEDENAFYDETCYMLAHQIAAPNSPQWFNTGLYCVYGINGPPQGHYYFDPEKNEIVKSTSSYKRPQPHACFILSIEDDLVNDGGIMDLLTREARLFKYGSGTGSNFSRIRGMNETLSGGGVSSGLLSFLKIGDRSASAIKSGGTTRRAAKMVTLDIDHPDVEKYINWKAGEEHKVASMVTGSVIIKEHIEAIKKALSNFNGHEDDRFNAEKNQELAAVLRSALGDKIPPAYLYQQLRRFEQGDNEIETVQYSTAWDDEAYNTVSGQSSNNSLRITDNFMRAVLNDEEWQLTSRTTGETVKSVKARKLWNDIAKTSWQCADPGVQFHTTINDWHTCPQGGEIRASNPCSEYMFLDDTACNLASINLAALYDKKEKTFNVEGYLYAIGMWTTILEISVVMAQFPSPRIAELSYQYRTLGLGYANLGALLMIMGLAYDSYEGRAVAGALSALLSGEAYAQSSRMAGEFGVFARYGENAVNMLRVIRNHRRAVNNAPDDEYEDLHTFPKGIDPAHCPGYLLEAAKASWDRALELGQKYGYRNAQVTAIAPTGTISFLMDCDTTGIEPDFALVKFKKLAGGGYFKIINQSVPYALEALGYSPQSIEEITAYAMGRKTLLHAPAINHETLKEKDFTAEAINAVEDAVKTALNFEEIFNPWTLGKAFVEKNLRVPESTYLLPGFSLLKHIGFSAEDIKEAELYACGAMVLENAPGLKIEHYPVFDTAAASSKKRNRCISWTAHIGMMAAVQPFISGAISKTINMPNSASYDDVKGAYMFSWKSALKSVALYRDGSKLSQPLNAIAPGTDPLADTIFKAEKEIDLSASKHDGTKTSTRGIRNHMPNRRVGYTQKVKIRGHSIFIRTGEYEDGTLGEIFLDMQKEGSAFRSILNSFAITVSLGLQYGVPLEEYVDAFTFSRFEPNGMVQGHDYIKMATSVIDYIFRDLAISYLKRSDLGQVKPEDLVATGTKNEIDVSDGKQRIENIDKSEKYSAGFRPIVPISPSQAVSSSSLSSQQLNAGKDSIKGQIQTADSTGANPYVASSSALVQHKEKRVMVSEDDSENDEDNQYQEENEVLKIIHARIKGYEGDACSSCGSFTLVRNGTCMKCETCGSTTGCS